MRKILDRCFFVTAPLNTVFIQDFFSLEFDKTFNFDCFSPATYHFVEGRKVIMLMLYVFYSLGLNWSSLVIQYYLEKSAFYLKILSNFKEVSFLADDPVY